MIFSMEKLKVAVIGVGHLGSIHAKIYKENPNVDLMGVCDTDKDKLNAVSGELGVPGYLDHKDLFAKVNAVSVVTPTKLHFKVAADFLNHNIHVLVEKPMSISVSEAEGLIKVNQVIMPEL